MKRNLSIDLVKVIAMFMVIAQHTPNEGTIGESWLLRSSYGIAGIAIPLFFMVSGYLMSGKQLTPRYSLRKIKGILRFVFLTISVFVLLLLVYHKFHFGQLRDTGTYLYQYIAWIFQEGFLWQYWYFAAMIIVYALCPLFGRIFHSRWLTPCIVSLIIVNFAFFIADSIFDLEKRYITQAFRVWYWFMYFLLGGYIRLHADKFKSISWLHAALMCVLYTLFLVSGISRAWGCEYYFGSVLCMIYAVTVFCSCVNTPIEHSRSITTLATLFLPVYAIHPAVIALLSHLSFISLMPPTAQYFAIYLIVCAANLAISYVLMHTPFVKNIFHL